jgi:hypothetical protein
MLIMHANDIAKRRAARGQAGFTMAEVMVALIVFIVAVVGLVAMESRGIEAQRASMETREGERLAQAVMAELMSTSFDELIEFDFAGGANPTLPYDDVELDSWALRDYGAVPNETGARAPGTRADFFWVGRRIDRWPTNGVSIPDAVQLEVTVLWIDYTNPAFPPPVELKVNKLIPGNLDPGDPDYLPYVRGVQLRTVRVNDARNPVEALP